MLNAHSLCFGKSNGGDKPTPLVPSLGRNALTLDISPETNHGADDGSLPTSPEYSCEESLRDAVALDEFTKDVLMEFFSPGSYYSPRRCPRRQKVLQTMGRVVDSLLVKHQFVYTGMLTKLSLDPSGGDLTLVSTVAKETFGDGVTNWGRIASLLAFGTVVCRYETENGRGNSAGVVAEMISSYLLSDQRKWLVKNKAWDGFVEFFRVPDPESTVRTALMAFATVAGIGASIAFLSR